MACLQVSRDTTVRLTSMSVLTPRVSTMGRVQRSGQAAMFASVPHGSRAASVRQSSMSVTVTPARGIRLVSVSRMATGECDQVATGVTTNGAG